MVNKLWQDKTDEEFEKDIKDIVEGFIKWRVEDYINTRDDLVNLMWAALDEIKSDKMQNIDFEYFLYACEDIVRIAKMKGWDTRKMS